MSSNKRDYYVAGETLNFEEDLTHEFKGHTSIAHEDIKDFGSRQPVSKVMCGFLNTGEGGTIYLGVADDGSVKGLYNTVYTRDHLLGSIEDTFERYTPPVEPHRYKIKFVPVVDTNPTVSDIKEVLDHQNNLELEADQEKRNTPHELRTLRYCWCHKDIKARLNNMNIPPCYVVEIRIRKWKADDAQNKYAAGQMRCQPIHQDETGRAWIRNHASVTEICLDDICKVAKTQVSDHYQPELERLQAELDALCKTDGLQ